MTSVRGQGERDLSCLSQQYKSTKNVHSGLEPDILEVMVVERQMLDKTERLLDICKHPQYAKLAKQQELLLQQTTETEKDTRRHSYPLLSDSIARLGVDAGDDGHVY
ncbi:hypothetical protein KOW79_017326 [Hemibagrus wyckioides]|uniref:Uncharacterized protein n=1 Tax=Hemibagrus wyckioides TaxID=337641 RepID=A0A9D3NAX4_9TELE|nr:hypothetical protein KOW79_017326 [Hemibagrus wyckioides]